MRVKLLVLFVILFNSAYSQNEKNHFQAVDANDPFLPYLTGEAPQIIKELNTETDSIKIAKIIFKSRDLNVDGVKIPTYVYAAIARPLKQGRYPGILVLHGGGGSAEIERIRKWAAKGYIAVSLDIPGVADPKKVLNSDGYWKTYAYGKNRFTITPDVSQSTIFDGTLAAVQAFYLLRSQQDVIKERIGITGISWGGYMTTMVTGLVNPYVCASFSTFGCGFYDTGTVFLNELDKMTRSDRDIWLKYLDAGRRAKYISTPFFIAAASNDNWFYPPAVMATLHAMKGRANHFFAPNSSHSSPVPGGSSLPNRVGFTQMEEPYFNLYLKEIGFALPEISEEEFRTKGRGDGRYRFKFRVKSKKQITAATIYYSTADSLWTSRKWVAVKASALSNGYYQAEIPEKAIGKDTWCFASVSDDRPVTVSSNLMSCNR
jgi:dienelactone hydrolase